MAPRVAKPVVHVSLTETARLDIEGMHCASCAVSVERALKATHGVLDAAVNPTTEVATVTVSPGTRTGALKLAVESVGHLVRAQAEARDGN